MPAQRSRKQRGRELHTVSACCAGHAEVRPGGHLCRGGSAPAWPNQQRNHVADIFEASGFELLHGETSIEWAVLSIQIFYFGTAC